MTVAVVIPGRSGRPQIIVRWSGGKRTVVVPGVWRDKAAAVMFRIDREISRKLAGRPPSVEAEIFALLATYPTARAYGLPESADPRVVPAAVTKHRRPRRGLPAVAK